MRVPFLRQRKKSPTMYQKGVGNEFDLLQQAQNHIHNLFQGNKQTDLKMEFIFEQLYIVYNLALFAGSHEVSAQTRHALCLLRKEFEYKAAGMPHIFLAETALACSKALKMGEAVLQELPRSEFKLAYVQAKKLSENRKALINYLELFHDKGNRHS